MAPRDLRVCFVGDSFVAGVGDPGHRGWVGRVAESAHREGRPLTAYNLGVRRQTSADVRVRWLGECAARLPAGCDGRVVFSFGVNDGAWEGGRPRVAPSDSVAHLTALLRAARERGWPAMVVGPPPVADGPHNDRTARLDVAFAALCGEAGVPFVRVFDRLLASDVWMGQVRAGDGAHPAADGYRELAVLVLPHWLGWLSPPTARSAPHLG